MRILICSSKEFLSHLEPLASWLTPCGITCSFTTAQPGNHRGYDAVIDLTTTNPTGTFFGINSEIAEGLILGCIDHLSSTGRVDQAMQLARQTIPLLNSEDQELKHQLAIFFFDIGETLFDQSAWDAAQHHLLQSVSVLESLSVAGAQRDLSIAYERLGDLARHTGDSESAVIYFTKALSLSTGGEALAILYDRLGDTLRSLNRPGEALVHYQRALAQQLPYNHRALAMSHLRISRVSAEDSEYHLAQAYLHLTYLRDTAGLTPQEEEVFLHIQTALTTPTPMSPSQFPEQKANYLS